MNLPRFDHEKLNVYQASIKFVTWATELISKVESKAAVKDQLDRASTSIPLNIAEGNGKFAIRDRCRFLDLPEVRRWNARLAWMFLLPRGYSKKKQCKRESNSFWKSFPC